MLFAPGSSGGGAGPVVPDDRSAKSGPRGASKATTASAFTDDPAELWAVVPRDASVDLSALQRARRIAATLAIPRSRQDVTPRRGSGELATTRYNDGSDDIDLDATLELLIEHPVPEEDDVMVRDRMSTRRSVVLVVDVSGSMRGERALTAAATVGALFGHLSRDRLGVVAFWSDAALVVPLGVATSAERVLDSLLRIPARGLTNVAFPLHVAARQLERKPARDARVLLLSDCVHNAGPDPRDAAARLPRLDVLVDTSGENDLDLAQDLARVGHGRTALAQQYRDVGPAVSRLFA